MFWPANTGSGESELIVTSRSRVQVTLSAAALVNVMHPLPFVAWSRYWFPLTPAWTLVMVSVVGVAPETHEIVQPPTLFASVVNETPLLVETYHWNDVALEMTGWKVAVVLGHALREAMSVVMAGAALMVAVVLAV